MNTITWMGEPIYLNLPIDIKDEKEIFSLSYFGASYLSPYRSGTFPPVPGQNPLCQRLSWEKVSYKGAHRTRGGVKL